MFLSCLAKNRAWELPDSPLHHLPRLPTAPSRALLCLSSTHLALAATATPLATMIMIMFSLLPVPKADTHEVTVRPTVGASGLGLIFGKEKEGTGWVVEGFQPTPDGERNPAKVTIGHETQALVGGGVGVARVRCFVWEKAGWVMIYFLSLSWKGT